MQNKLGHADAETTLQIYTDAMKDLKKSEMVNFEDYYDMVFQNFAKQMGN